LPIRSRYPGTSNVCWHTCMMQSSRCCCGRTAAPQHEGCVWLRTGYNKSTTIGFGRESPTLSTQNISTCTLHCKGNCSCTEKHITAAHEQAGWPMKSHTMLLAINNSVTRNYQQSLTAAMPRMPLPIARLEEGCIRFVRILHDPHHLEDCI
jgi:hypothetical protein